MSRPSSITRPVVGSISRASSLTIVDLPEPVRPTIASLPPAGTLTLTFLSAYGMFGRNPSPLVELAGEVAERDVIPFDRASDRSRAPFASTVTVGTAPKISPRRFIEALPR